MNERDTRNGIDLAHIIMEANSLDTLSIHVLEGHLCKVSMCVLDIDLCCLYCFSSMVEQFLNG